MALPQPAASQVSRFCRQFLQLEPVLDYPAANVLREESAQEHIYRLLFADSPAPAPPRYRLAVLKSLVAAIEASIVDWDTHGISDNLSDALSRLIAVPLADEWIAVQEKCYVTYHQSLLDVGSARVDVDVRIVLLEQRSLISAAGTTGLRTWEAALHLGCYLCANASLVAGKRVLELGAGTGYLAILCAKYLGAAHVIASDGSDDVVNNLPDNFFLNGLQGAGGRSRSRISPMDLKWGHALVGTEELAWNSGRPIDLVLGADITYDEAITPPLVATLDEVACLFPGVVILVAATERNKSTFDNFLKACAAAGLAADKVSYPVPRREEQNGPFYDCGVPIHICRLVRGTVASLAR